MLVQEKRQECLGIVSLYLKPYDQKVLPTFHPGQHLTLFWEQLGDKKKVRRCYSLSSSPKTTDSYRLSIKLQEYEDGRRGLVSQQIHDAVAQNDSLMVLAPQGHFFWSAEMEQPPVFIATGIGITPFVSMLHAIADSHNPPAEAWLFWGIKSPEYLPFKEELISIKRSFPALKIVIGYSQKTSDGLEWVDHLLENQRLSMDAIKKILGHNEYHFFLCGSTQMMLEFRQNLTAWGVDSKHVSYESFGSPATPARKKKENADEGMAINLAKSFITGVYSENYSNLLELLEELDAPVGVGCRTGNCGACLCICKTGDVDYVQEPGYGLESRQILPCIAVPRSPLELDI